RFGYLPIRRQRDLLGLQQYAVFADVNRALAARKSVTSIREINNGGRFFQRRTRGGDFYHLCVARDAFRANSDCVERNLSSFELGQRFCPLLGSIIGAVGD